MRIDFKGFCARVSFLSSIIILASLSVQIIIMRFSFQFCSLFLIVNCAIYA